MKSPGPEQQLIRLASDNASVYQDAWRWFQTQGSSGASALVQGLENSSLGAVCQWRILLLLREFQLPSTLPAILKSFHLALQRKDPIILPGAMEALAVFNTDEALSALASVLKSADADYVRHASALLGNLSDRAVQPIAALLAHEEVGVRKSAIQVLRRINTPVAHEALKRHLGQETAPELVTLINTKP